MCFISYAIGELVFWSSYHASLTSAVASLFHFSLDTLAAGIVTGLITEVSKVLVGRYRPDWLSRCNPSIPYPVTIGPYGRPATENPICNSTLSENKLTDGQKSFPSGHASTVFSLSVYGCVYCLWAACYRPVKATYTTTGSSFKRRVINDTLSFLILVWVLWQISFAWGVAISRVIDHKHHPSDIIGGAFLGTMIAVIFSVRAIPRHYRVADVPVDSRQPLLDGSVPRTDHDSSLGAGMNNP
jgi:membrane-associated phospholipid phosphatase